MTHNTPWKNVLAVTGFYKPSVLDEEVTMRFWDASDLLIFLRTN